MPIGIGSTNHHVPVMVHEREVTTTNADATTIRDIDGLGPKRLAGAGVQRHSQSDVECLEFRFLFLCFLCLRVHLVA